MEQKLSKRAESLRYNNSISKILNYRIKKAKQRANKFKMDFNLDLDYLTKVFNTQNGKCFYSQRKLDLGSNNQNTITIDRINSDFGYVKGNVVLCCFCVNSAKNELSMEEFNLLIKDLFMNRFSGKLYIE